MDKGLLIVIAGPSGVGKGTICAEILKDNDDISLSVSATTREPREGEIDGVNYHFVSNNEFDEMIENDEFLEYANVFENKYGTPRKYVNDTINKGKDVIVEIDVQGAMMVMDNCEEGLYIFISPKSLEVLSERLINRGTETKEQFEIRTQKAKWEIEQCEKFEYVVVNDDLDTAVEEVKDIIKSFRRKVFLNKALLKKLLSE